MIDTSIAFAVIGFFLKSEAFLFLVLVPLLAIRKWIV